MNLINKKRFSVQFNRSFFEGYLLLVFLISITFGVIACLLLPYDINESYKGMKLNGFLAFLYIISPRSYNSEKFKLDLGYFMSLNYTRKEYFKNKIIIINSIIVFSVLVSTILMFMMFNSADHNIFGYLGLTMKKDLISFFKINLINITAYNLFYNFIIMAQILFIKIIPNKAKSLLFYTLLGVASLIFWRGLGSDIYVKITAPILTLACSILFILLSYFVQYKFIMTLDV